MMRSEYRGAMIFLISILAFFIPRCGIAKLYGSSTLIFKEHSMLFCIVSTLFYIPTNNAQFLKNHANTCNTVVPDGYEVISHCGFDLYFSNDSVMQSIFSYACSPFVYLL